MVELNPKLARIKRPLTDENKENRTPVFCPSDPNHRSATVNHALTLPRINANPERETSVQTPCFIPSSTPRQQSKSEPCAKPLQNITNIIKKQSSDRFAKDTTACEDEEALKTKALWEHQDAQHMARHLNLQLEKSVIKACSTPILLFRWLEQNKMLTAKVLKFFADCPEINTLDLGPTYASRMNEFGLIENGILSAKKCTAPLFTGYGRLKVLDLTNVLIGDDELRYLIKLQSLEAIGLAGTKVTNKGLKYLAKHALFKPRLMCIKLCYNDQIDDESLVVLRKFEQLTEIDLWGCSKIQMEGCIALLQGPNRIQKVRLPIHLEKRINELHVYYAKADSSIVSSPKVSMELSETDMIRQLKFHKSQFPDVFLNLAKEDLRKKFRKKCIKCHIKRCK